MVDVLNFNFQTVNSLEGYVIDGSISVDATSDIRRTCNLTMVAKDVNISDFYWGVSNKFTLEIGVKNQINSDYFLYGMAAGNFTDVSYKTKQIYKRI